MVGACLECRAAAGAHACCWPAALPASRLSPARLRFGAAHPHSPHLAAVGPVDLVAVVFLGVMRRRDHDARRRAQQLGPKGHKRRRRDAREEADAVAARQKDARREVCEFGRVVARVKACRAFFLFCFCFCGARRVKVKA